MMLGVCAGIIIGVGAGVGVAEGGALPDRFERLALALAPAQRDALAFAPVIHFTSSDTSTLPISTFSDPYEFLRLELPSCELACELRLLELPCECALSWLCLLEVRMPVAPSVALFDDPLCKRRRSPARLRAGARPGAACATEGSEFAVPMHAGVVACACADSDAPVTPCSTSLSASLCVSLSASSSSSSRMLSPPRPISAAQSS
mmetsp:Transcript_19309/g.40357  ORF Transcript_19309/g.40357 Transcript_19309/m.40357 type:complete len:205 (-) Transcript_19309:809-1423(-)